MDANPVAAFVAALSEHQLLQPAQLEQVNRSPLLQGNDPRPLSKELIERGWLTSYQVNLLLAGRGKELLAGPYVLVDRIGEGGMGQVFKARSRTANQPVAVKLVRNQLLANPNALKRFWQEVNLTAQLRHPNIVIAYGAGQADRSHYFAMEYIEGIDLFRLVKESGPLPVGQACEIMRQAALGLQHAHEKGLVHRDIKPANLMVAGSQVKLLDLGLARLQDQENGLTRIGAILGTPEFLSPEQTQNSRAVDVRSDLYSLGCTFFFILIGKEPFSGASVPEILLKHHFDEPPLLTPLRPDIPAGVQSIVRKLMAKRPEDRYQTPTELAEALKPLCQPINLAMLRPGGAAAATGRPAKQGKVASVFALMLRRKGKGKVAAAAAPVRRRRLARTKRPLLVFSVCILLIALGMFLLESTFGITGLTKPTDKPSEVAALSASTPDESSKPATEPATRPETRRESRPESKPETRPETKPEPRPTKPEPKSTKPEPRPVVKKETPDADTLAAAEKQVRAAHQEDYAKKKPAEQLALASRLVREANAFQDDPAVRFVLFREARNLAAQAGDVEESYRIITELAGWFTVNMRQQRAEALDAAAGNADLPATQMKAIAEKALTQAEYAVDADDYEAACQMLTAAEAAAGKAGSTALVNRAKSRSKEVAEIGKEYALVKGLQPNSAEANFRMGRFQCLFRGKWREGLPLLAKGSNEEWKALAQKEQDDPSISSKQLELAEGWFLQSEHEKGMAQRQMLLRARHWYEQAVPKLTEFPLRKAKKRLEEIAQKTGEASTTPVKTGSGSVIITGKEYEKWMQAGKAAYDAEKFGDAVQAFGTALYYKPNDPEAMAARNQAIAARQEANYAQHMAKGASLMEKKRYAEAATEFRLALKDKPDDAEALAALEKAKAAMK